METTGLRHAELAEEKAQVRTVDLGMPDKDDFFASLRRYREYLKIEYPRYYWNPNYEPWLPEDIEMPVAEDHIPRMVAKGVYNREYYEDGPIAQALDEFAKSINASKTVSIVFVAFGLAGGTGSGIAVDIVRHLSSVKLGRRHIVVGVGVLPSEGDPAETHDGTLFPVINEVDCMLDEEKNAGAQAGIGRFYEVSNVTASEYRENRAPAHRAPRPPGRKMRADVPIVILSTVRSRRLNWRVLE